MDKCREEEKVVKEVKLKAIEATPESFSEYGQVIQAKPDSEHFGPDDAQLDLSHGIPRSKEIGASNPIYLRDSTKTYFLAIAAESIIRVIIRGCTFIVYSSAPYNQGRLLLHNPLLIQLASSVHNLEVLHNGLQDRELKFSRITHHANVTQCLGSIGGHVWYLGVAKPSIVNSSENIGASSKKVVKSHSGHFYVPPNVEEVRVFRITGPKFLKLNAGTWHAGPLFLLDAMEFYNLELSDTNVVDHTTHNFEKEDGVCFVIDE